MTCVYTITPNERDFLVSESSIINKPLAVRIPRDEQGINIIHFLVGDKKMRFVTASTYSVNFNTELMLMLVAIYGRA